ncbi:Centrosome and spindle pole associated protein 1 [Trichoplax sp. H2]|nr:Centrosome and spindle pole associated protein 1 [Trichoplax sp. H2]|eukprot:RDD37398.1 Centrosome and spindle pole associated protein 1 [Trichoplax sp. H2]
MATQDEMTRFIQLQKAKLHHERQQIGPESSNPVRSFNQAGTTSNLSNERSDLRPTQSDGAFTLRDSHNNQINHNSEDIHNLHRTHSLWDKLGDDGLTMKQNFKKRREDEFKEFADNKKYGRYNRNINENNYQGLSLPIREQNSAKERLKKERQREYNEFLQEKLRRETEGKSRRRNNLNDAMQPQNYHSKPVGYDQLLQQKREQEERYRQLNHIETAPADFVPSKPKFDLQHSRDPRYNLPIPENRPVEWQLGDEDLYAWARQKANNHDAPDDIGRLPYDINLGNGQGNVPLSNNSPLLDAVTQLTDPRLRSDYPPDEVPRASYSNNNAVPVRNADYPGAVSRNNYVQAKGNSVLDHSHRRIGNHDPPNAHYRTSSQNQSSNILLGFSGSEDKPRYDKSSYQQDLKQQMLEMENRKKQEKKRREAEELKKEQEIYDYNPWGKGGGGAPLRDRHGRIVADLKRMHVDNETKLLNPNTNENRSQPNPSLSSNNNNQYSNAASPRREPNSLNEPNYSYNQPNRETTEVVTKLTSEGFMTQESPRKSETDYRAYLKQQIEEKERRKREEQEKIRQEELKEMQRIEDQRKIMQEEHEKELEGKRKKEEEENRQKEEAAQKIKEQREASERAQREAEENRRQKADDDLKRRLAESRKKPYEQEASNQQNSPVRSNSPPIPALRQSYNQSPPIPALRNEQGNPTSPPLPSHRQVTNTNSDIYNQDDEIPSHSEIQPLKLSRSQTFNEVTLSQRDNDIYRSHPKSSRNNSISGNASTIPNNSNTRPFNRTAEETKDVIAQLELMRQQLKLEQAKVQEQLEQNKKAYEGLLRNEELKLQAHMEQNKKAKERRLSRSKNKADIFAMALPKNKGGNQNNATSEFNSLKYGNGSESRQEFWKEYPEPAESSASLEVQQQALLDKQEHQLKMLREGDLAADLDVNSHPTNHHHQASNRKPDSESQLSLLTSETKFVPVDDNGNNVKGSTDENSTKVSSARERRRIRQRDELPSTPASISSLNIDAINEKNKERLLRLEKLTERRKKNDTLEPSAVLEEYLEK